MNVTAVRTPIAQRRPHVSLADTGKRAAGVMAAGLLRTFGSRAAGHPSILVYHRVAEHTLGVPTPSINVTPSRFRDQLTGLLKRGFVARPLLDLLECHACGQPVPPNSFAVTFDDGHGTVFTRALPVLHDLRVPATVFVNTAFLDSTDPFPFDNWANAHVDSVPSEAVRPLTVAECREMAASGLVTLGAHTHTHADFRGRAEAFRDDLQLSVDSVREQFEVDAVTFAFPFGRRALGYVDDALMTAARETGVVCALTTEADVVDPRTDPFGWGRFNVYEWDTATTLAAKLGGWYGWAPRAEERLAGRLRRSAR